MTQSNNTHRLAVATKALLTLLLVVAVVWGYDTCVGKKDRDQYPVTNSNEPALGYRHSNAKWRLSRIAPIPCQRQERPKRCGADEYNF